MIETLETLRRAAEKCRPNYRGRVPEALKEMAVRLLEKHPAREVAKAARVSSGQVVEGWRRRYEGACLPGPQMNVVAAETSDFVELPAVLLGNGGVNRAGALELELEDGEGRRLRLRGELNAAQLQALVAGAFFACEGRDA